MRAGSTKSYAATVLKKIYKIKIVLRYRTLVSSYENLSVCLALNFMQKECPNVEIKQNTLSFLAQLSRNRNKT